VIEEHAESFEQPDELVRCIGDPARLAEVEALVWRHGRRMAMGKMKSRTSPPTSTNDGDKEG